MTKFSTELLGGATTGDAKITLKTVADTGWLMMNDGTIGSASSGASYANVAALALFTLIFNVTADSAAPILTSAGAATTRAAQTNAATAWAANCRMSLTKQLGRSIAIAGSGAGLSTRPLGSAYGAETETPTVSNMANHAHGDTGHQHYTPMGSIGVELGSSYTAVALVAANWTEVSAVAQANISSSGSGGVLNVLDPSAYWNVMIKL